MALVELPLFPLATVLFPGGPLPLRVFETRYLDMIGRCLRERTGFGVVLIAAGSETGEARTFDVGTVAEIVDWYQGADGVLGVTVEGRDRFRLHASRRCDDGLYLGEVELLGREPRQGLRETDRRAVDVLQAVLDELGRHYQAIPRAYQDASWVGYRLAEILPLPAAERQRLLEMEDAHARLDVLAQALAE